MRLLPLFVLAGSLLLCRTAVAGWEDDGATDAPATGRTGIQRKIPAPSSTSARPSAATGTIPADIYSQFLDAPVDPVYWASLAYVGPTQFGGDESASMVELDGFWRLAVYRDVLLGDVDLNLSLHSVIFAGSAGQDVLPAMLVALPLDAGWRWRFVDGASFEVRAKPGIYADPAAAGLGMFGLPLSVAWYRTVSPDLSIMAGVELRPGWDQFAMPLIGAAWEPNDALRLELALPRSRGFVYLGPVTLLGAIEWRNTTFAMSGGGNEPDSLTMNDVLLSGGVRVAAGDQLTLGAELGVFLDRTMTAEGEAGEGDIDLSNAMFLRLSVGGPL
jgi:hypothetical protein